MTVAAGRPPRWPGLVEISLAPQWGRRSTVDIASTPDPEEGPPMKPPVQEWTAAAVQLAEKALATWLQAFIVALIGTTFFESLDFSVLAAAAVAVIPAGVTVLANAATTAAAPSTWPPRGQALFRVVRTFVATFLSFLAAAVWTLDVTSTRALIYSAAAAAGTAFLAAIKAELATYVGDPRTTAMIPARFEQFALAA